MTENCVDLTDDINDETDADVAELQELEAELQQVTRCCAACEWRKPHHACTNHDVTISSRRAPTLRDPGTGCQL